MIIINSKLKRLNGPAFDSVLLAFIQIITYVANMATAKILSVCFSLIEYGTYSTVNTIITIAASLTLFGLGDSINYYYNGKSQQTDSKTKEEYINTIFFIQFVVGVGVGFVLILCEGLISDYYNNILLKPLILIVCLKPLLSNATHLYQVLFVSSGKAKLIAVRNLIISVVKVLVVIIAAVLSNNIALIFIFLVLLDLVQLVTFKLIFGNIRFKVKPFHFDSSKLLPVLKYTIPMGVYFVTTTLMREIDKLVIGRMSSTEELAIYSNCAKTLPVNILVSALATVLVPYIMKSVSSKEYPLTAKILRQYFSIGYLSVWMFSGALILCAPEAINFFYASEYVAGLPVFVLYILDGMIQFAGVHLVLAASGDSKYLMITSLSLLGLNAVLSVVLHIVFQGLGMALIGPALATVLISVMYVCILYCKTSRILQLKISEFLPIRNMMAYLVELLILGGVFYIIKIGLQKLQVHWMIVLFGLCLGYCGMIMIIHRKEYKNILSQINQLKTFGEGYLK